MIRHGLLTAALLALSTPSVGQAEAGLRVSTVPSPIILTQSADQVRIDVEGVTGSGPLRAAVNVGEVRQVRARPGGATLVYETPMEKFPQRLCLMVWRKSGADPRIHVVRLLMHGRTIVPISTRPDSKITVSVGRRMFGPYDTGRRGKRNVRLVVPPEETHARVLVTDRFGLKTKKKIRINMPRFNPLAVAIIPLPDSGGTPRFRIAAASSNASHGEITLMAGAGRVGMQRIRPGVWSALWTPGPDQQSGDLTVRAWTPGGEEKPLKISVDLYPSASRAGGARAARPRPPGPRPDEEDRLQLNLALGMGMLHNTGDLFSLRFSLEAGIDLRLPVGWLGFHLMLSVAWASQELVGPRDLGVVENQIVLFPFGMGLTYRYPLSLFTPYICTAILAQLIHSDTTAKQPVGYERVDWSFAFLGLLGAERELGPGRVFFQTGIQWSRIDRSNLELLAGGFILETGYRFRF